MVAACHRCMTGKSVYKIQAIHNRTFLRTPFKGTLQFGIDGLKGRVADREAGLTY